LTHISPILIKLHHYLKKIAADANRRRSLTSSTSRQIFVRILQFITRIPNIGTCGETAGDLCQLLLPYLQLSCATDEIKINVLNLIRAALPHASNALLFAKPVASLFQILRSPTMRQMLSEIYRVIQDVSAPNLTNGLFLSLSFSLSPSLFLSFFLSLSLIFFFLFIDETGMYLINNIAAIITELNSTAKGRLGEYDFDRQQDAFNELFQMDFSSLTWYDHIAVVTNLLFFLQYDDFTVHQNALHAIKRWIAFVATQAPIELSSTTTGPRISKLISSIVLPTVRKLMRAPSRGGKPWLIQRSPIIEALACVLRNFPTTHGVGCASLCGESGGFFYNVTHIQKHKKSKAFGKLTSQLRRAHPLQDQIASVLREDIEDEEETNANAIEEPDEDDEAETESNDQLEEGEEKTPVKSSAVSATPLPAVILIDYIAPLILNFISEADVKGTEHMEVDSAVAAMGAISLSLNWRMYSKVCFKFIVNSFVES
jgi:hypothetical protein